MEHLVVLVNIVVIMRIIPFQMLYGDDLDQVLIEQGDVNRLSMGVRFWLKSFSARKNHRKVVFYARRRDSCR